MTHTISVDKYTNNGAQRSIEATVTISSYTTGGEDLSDFVALFGSCDFVVAFPGGTVGYMMCWIDATNKLKLLTATTTECGSTVNVGVVYVKAWGV